MCGPWTPGRTRARLCSCTSLTTSISLHSVGGGRLRGSGRPGYHPATRCGPALGIHPPCASPPPTHGGPRGLGHPITPLASETCRVPPPAVDRAPCHVGPTSPTRHGRGAGCPPASCLSTTGRRRGQQWLSPCRRSDHSHPRPPHPSLPWSRPQWTPQQSRNHNSSHSNRSRSVRRCPHGSSRFETST